MPAAGTQARSVVPSTTENRTPIWHPSPNFGARRDGLKPDLVVIHYTAMESAQAALDRLCDPAAEVSAHYLIGGDGIVWQMVQEADRAWHAGAGKWCGQADINSRSIGIELDNNGTRPFSEPQMAALEHLLSDIVIRHDIQPWRVIGHSDMAPERKQDPGPKFDWDRLAIQNLAIGPSTISDPPISEIQVDESGFCACARRAGYPDAPLNALLAAFRNRFAPMRQGPLSTLDMGGIARLAEAIENLDGPQDPV
ncbi:MAG: N-acetylmuramoyl-L-alanine amidase [Ruegeria sp.]